MGLVQSLLDYLALHGPVDSALFQSLEGRPISSPLFYRIIVLGIRSCGLDPTEYKGHSFRIGGGELLSLLKAGCLKPQIRLLGRWKFDAFRRYIRVPTLQT